MLFSNSVTPCSCLNVSANSCTSCSWKRNNDPLARLPCPTAHKGKLFLKMFQNHRITVPVCSHLFSLAIARPLKQVAQSSRFGPNVSSRQKPPEASGNLRFTLPLSCSFCESTSLVRSSILSSASARRWSDMALLIRTALCRFIASRSDNICGVKCGKESIFTASSTTLFLPTRRNARCWEMFGVHLLSVTRQHRWNKAHLPRILFRLSVKNFLFLVLVAKNTELFIRLHRD